MCLSLPRVGHLPLLPSLLIWLDFSVSPAQISCGFVCFVWLFIFLKLVTVLLQGLTI